MQYKELLFDYSIPSNQIATLNSHYLCCDAIETIEQNALVGSTVHSYLSWLKDTGRMKVLFETGQLLWKTIQCA